MSAAEKLKALDRAMMEGPWHYDEPPLRDLTVLRNALPQIVAVVEAAERFDDEDESAMAWANIKRDLRMALSALDEALGDVT